MSNEKTLPRRRSGRLAPPANVPPPPERAPAAKTPERHAAFEAATIEALRQHAVAIKQLQQMQIQTGNDTATVKEDLQAGLERLDISIGMLTRRLDELEAQAMRRDDAEFAALVQPAAPAAPAAKPNMFAPVLADLRARARNVFLVVAAVVLAISIAFLAGYKVGNAHAKAQHTIGVDEGASQGRALQWAEDSAYVAQACIAARTGGSAQARYATQRLQAQNPELRFGRLTDDPRDSRNARVQAYEESEAQAKAYEAKHPVIRKATAADFVDTPAKPMSRADSLHAEGF